VTSQTSPPEVSMAFPQETLKLGAANKGMPQAAVNHILATKTKQRMGLSRQCNHTRADETRRNLTEGTWRTRTS